MTIKRIALITPPYHSGVVESAGTWLNVGFVYIAGSLRAAGYEVDYYDAMSLWHKWPDIQKRDRGVSARMSLPPPPLPPPLSMPWNCCGLAKEINPDIVTVHRQCPCHLLLRRNPQGMITIPLITSCGAKVK